MWMRLSRKCVHGNKGLLTQSPGRPCRADEGRRSQRLGKRTSRSWEPGDSREGSGEPGDERVKGQQGRSNAGFRDLGQSGFRVMVGAEAGAGWRREGHKAMDSSEPNPPSGTVLGAGKEAVG